ncbi:MAG: flavodoxin domain-containing protein [Methyloceanibacter sp.]
MNVLIVYGTTEGQTRKIAEWTATHVHERGHQVELRDSAAPFDLDLETFHALIVAAFARSSLLLVDVRCQIGCQFLKQTDRTEADALKLPTHGGDDR